MIQTYLYYRKASVHSFEGYEYYREVATWKESTSDDPFAVAKDFGSGPQYVTLMSVSQPSFVYTPGSFVYYPETPVLKPGVELVTETQYNEYQTRLLQHFEDNTGDPPE